MNMTLNSARPYEGAENKHNVTLPGSEGRTEAFGFLQHTDFSIRSIHSENISYSYRNKNTIPQYQLLKVGFNFRT